jgi:two-component system, OmpR family, response regulator CpxR
VLPQTGEGAERLTASVIEYAQHPGIVSEILSPEGEAAALGPDRASRKNASPFPLFLPESVPELALIDVFLKRPALCLRIKARRWSVEVCVASEGTNRHPHDHIALISDDPALGNLLSTAFVSQGFTFECVTASEALARPFHSPPAVVLLDELPTGASTWLAHFQTLRQQIRAPLVLLTGPGADTDRILGLELGADDSLSKPFNRRELLARIRAVLRRGRQRSWGPAVVDDLQLDMATREVRRGETLLTLTAMEFELLGVLLQNAGEVVSRDLLASVGLGRALGPMDRSLDVHMSRLRKKLGPHADGGERIQSVRGFGYVYRRASSGGAGPVTSATPRGSIGPG